MGQRAKEKTSDRFGTHHWEQHESPANGSDRSTSWQRVLSRLGAWLSKGPVPLPAACRPRRRTVGLSRGPVSFERDYLCFLSFVRADADAVARSQLKPSTRSSSASSSSPPSFAPAAAASASAAVAAAFARRLLAIPVLPRPHFTSSAGRSVAVRFREFTRCRWTCPGPNDRACFPAWLRSATRDDIGERVSLCRRSKENTTKSDAMMISARVAVTQ